MPGYFGEDFKIGQPSNDDQVKRGAYWICQLKAHLVNFVSRYWVPETGDWQTNVIPPSALKSLEPSPGASSGTMTGNRVTVNSKGLVTSVHQVDPPIGTQLYAAWFEADASAIWDHATDQITNANATRTLVEGQAVAQYTFTVPAADEENNKSGVTRLRIRGQGPGGGGATGATAWGGGGGAYFDVNMAVSPGDLLTIWVGLGGVGQTNSTEATDGGLTQVKISENRWVKAPGGLSGNNIAPGSGGALASYTFSDPQHGICGLKREGGTATQLATGVGGLGGRPGDGGVALICPGAGGSAKVSANGSAGSSGYVYVEYWY
jgi:hypothetical protein